MGIRARLIWLSGSWKRPGQYSRRNFLFGKEETEKIKSFHFDFVLNPDFWKISAPIQNRQAWQSSGREVALADSEEACGGFRLPQAILLVRGECPLTVAHIPSVGFSKPVIWQGKDWQLFIWKTTLWRLIAWGIGSEGSMAGLARPRRPLVHSHWLFLPVESPGMPAAFFAPPFSCCLFSEMQKSQAVPSSDLHAKECQLHHDRVRCPAPWDVFSFQLREAYISK